MRRFVLFLTVTVALVGAPSAAFASGPTELLPMPPGYAVSTREELGAGLVHYRLTRRAPAQVVHVARRAPGAPSELRVVLSNDAVAGSAPTAELTSSMCVRVHCLVGVNGDFWAWTGEPIGAVVSGGSLLRSPNGRHHQLTMSPDGSFETGLLEFRGRLVPEDLRHLEIDGVNVERRADKAVLFTHAFGPRTGTNGYGIELLLSTVRPEGPLRLGQTTVMEMTEFRRGGDTPIPPGGAVLSAHGRAAASLEALWRRVEAGTVGTEALLRLDTTPSAAESIGGSPILVRDGQRWFADDARELYSKRHPRSVAGWTADGALLLVTVDGRQPGYSEGMTMVETAELMVGLGATEAINLDGGGSTTFVVGGMVVNRPSDRAVRRNGETKIVQIPRSGERVLGNVERPVAVSLVLIPDRVPAETNRSGLGRAWQIPLGKPVVRGLSQAGQAGSSPVLLATDGNEPQAAPEIAAMFVALAAGAAVWRRRSRAYARS